MSEYERVIEGESLRVVSVGVVKEREKSVDVLEVLEVLWKFHHIDERIVFH